MAMGWWKPYFFLDPDGVQFLLPNLVIDGGTETLFVSALSIALLALIDRYMAHTSRSTSIYFSAFCFTIQKLTSGLLMLIMMSFNVVLFLEVVLFSGVAELFVKSQKQQQEGGNFERLSTSEIEMDGC